LISGVGPTQSLPEDFDASIPTLALISRWGARCIKARA
jgi:hypothetical protein